MSTVPKLSYAKTGNRSKHKLEGSSLQLNRNSQDDLFGHMNQDNLRYIQKQIKLKKNRSQNQRGNYKQQQMTQDMPGQQQINKKPQLLFERYRQQEKVSQKQSHLEQTQRKGSENNPVSLGLPQDAQQPYHQPFELSNRLSHKQPVQKLLAVENQVMFKSFPNNDTKIRAISIQGNFKESASSNLNKSADEGPKFIDFLTDYITDLNKSKHVKHRTSQEVMDHIQTLQSKSHKNTHPTPQQQPMSASEQPKSNDFRYRVSYQTFGEHKGSRQRELDLLRQQLRKQKYGSIVLAQQIEKLREQSDKKNATIQQLLIDKELLQQEIVHMRRQQEIRQGSRAPSSYRKEPQPKARYRTADQNILYQASNLTNLMTHHRHASVNPSRYNRNTTHKEQSHPSHQKLVLFKQFEEAQGQRQRFSRESSWERCQKESRKFSKEHSSNLEMFSMRKKSKPGKGVADFY